MKKFLLQAAFLFLIPVILMGGVNDFAALARQNDESVNAYLSRINCEIQKGNADALFKMGMIYFDGEIVPQSDVIAFEYYQKADKAGSYRGTAMLGFCYDKGHGVERNVDLAYPLYRRAAQIGSAGAARNMALSYDQGDSIEKNIAEAIRWFEKSYELGDWDDKVAVGKYYMLTYQDTLYEARGLKILEDAATNHDHTEAQRFLGTTYYLQPRTFNAEKAFYWLQKAAAKGNAAAEFYLGKMYMRGDNPPAMDERKAMALWEKAADKDYPQALFGVGIYNVMGEGGLTQNPAKGLPYLLKAANLGDHDAQRMLGYLYLDGSILPKDTKQGVGFLEKAAAQGDAQALSTLADLYLSGQAVPQDWDKALEMAKAAAAKGDIRARELVNAFTQIGEARKALGPDVALAAKEAAAQEAPHKQGALAPYTPAAAPTAAAVPAATASAP